MALEWVVVGCIAAAEAAMLLLLTLPGFDRLRPRLVAATRNAVKPMLSLIPFCIFLFLDIYWKYESGQSCGDERACSPTEYLRHQKSIMKCQRNAILVAATLLLNWLLLSITRLVVHIEQLRQLVENLKRRD